jgi:hypothetical protein
MKVECAGPCATAGGDVMIHFNSHYVAAGSRDARSHRGLITRPDSSEVATFRAHVDLSLERLVAGAGDSKVREVLRALEIGVHHERQHQYLILTDLLLAFAQDPVTPPTIHPGVRSPRRRDMRAPAIAISSIRRRAGSEAAYVSLIMSMNARSNARSG